MDTRLLRKAAILLLLFLPLNLHAAIINTGEQISLVFTPDNFPQAPTATTGQDGAQITLQFNSLSMITPGGIVPTPESFSAGESVQVDYYQSSTDLSPFNTMIFEGGDPQGFYIHVFFDHLFNGTADPWEDLEGMFTLTALEGEFEFLGADVYIHQGGFTHHAQLQPVPVPAAIWLMLSGLVSLLALRRAH